MHGVTRAIVVFAIALVAAGCATGRQSTSPTPATTNSAPRDTATAAQSSAPRATADPTQGRFINATTWSLRVWVDEPPANSTAAATVTLQPGETVPWTLGRGQHRIVAHAFSVTSPSDKSDNAVARFDRTIALDPNRPNGWFLRFREADFR